MSRPITVEQFLRKTEAEELLQHVVPDKHRITARAALRHLNDYVQGAAVQQRRIERLERQLTARIARERDASPTMPSAKRRVQDMSGMAREIHYYLLCWSAVVRDLRLLEEVTRSQALRRELRPHRLLFKQYTDMRDHLEHFDDRLRQHAEPELGLRRRRTMKRPWDMGNFSRGTFSFGGERVDISARSLVTLRHIVERARWALKVEAWTTLNDEQPAVADRLAARFINERGIAQIIRRLQREAGGGAPT